MFINAKTLPSLIQQLRWSSSHNSFTNGNTPPRFSYRSYAIAWLRCCAVIIALTIGSNCICYAQCSSSIPVTPLTVTDETTNLPSSRQLVNGTNTTVITTTPGQISVLALTKFTLYAKSASFTASDGAGSYYRTSATAIITLPATPADGSVYKFKVTAGTSTFVFNGSDTINHAFGGSDQSLSLNAAQGVLELIAVPGGWDET